MVPSPLVTAADDSAVGVAAHGARSSPGTFDRRVHPGVLVLHPGDQGAGQARSLVQRRPDEFVLGGVVGVQAVEVELDVPRDGGRPVRRSGRHGHDELACLIEAPPDEAVDQRHLPRVRLRCRGGARAHAAPYHHPNSLVTFTSE